MKSCANSAELQPWRRASLFQHLPRFRPAYSTLQAPPAAVAHRPRRAVFPVAAAGEDERCEMLSCLKSRANDVCEAIHSVTVQKEARDTVSLRERKP